MVSWSTSTLDWFDTPDLFHSLSLYSVRRRKNVIVKKEQFFFLGQVKLHSKTKFKTKLYRPRFTIKTPYTFNSVTSFSKAVSTGGLVSITCKSQTVAICVKRYKFKIENQSVGIIYPKSQMLAKSQMSRQ